MTVDDELQAAILTWFDGARRDLPFRSTRDPFAILVSEAMAQQTQAARAGVAWTRFIALWPTPASLAAANLADVLRAWQGLGYNRRALNLWRTARQIVDVHGGEVPADVATLETLPGVGPYTARAVAAIAFGMPVGAVDTNVRRVLSRLLFGDAAGPPPVELQRVADAAVPRDRPESWTHALMDLGATICTPRRPACAGCPARQWCAYAGDTGRAAVIRRAGRSTGRAPRTAFPETSRWLRGRIIDTLRSAPNDAWVVIDGPIGSHDRRAVAVALRALARDGLVELADAAASAPRHGKDEAAVRARLAVG